MTLLGVALISLLLGGRGCGWAAEDPAVRSLPAADGYRGIWYFNQPSHDEYVYKYSGGLATYPQQHIPLAVYAPEVQRTFFVYGGTTAQHAGDQQELLHMVAWYDHRTGHVPRPRILLNKHTADAHDNPVLAVDDTGHLWVFSPAHGTSRPSYIHRSTRPWSIDEFERIWTGNFSYPQCWFMPGRGFLFLHTLYRRPGDAGRAIRRLYWRTSPDGREWSEPHPFAAIDMGDYQISWRRGNRVATAFDFHPSPVGLNARANIYYAETDDLGATWRNVEGKPLALPLTEESNAALAYNSRRDGLLVYLKDLNFDPAGRPVILFLTSRGYEPGPKNHPRTWKTAHWTGRQWRIRSLTTSLNNYDHGSLYIAPDGTWRVIAPTEPGPQPYNPGGEMTLWTSRDEGKTWQLSRRLTQHSRRNHTYARRPLNAHPDFAAFWADGHARRPSASSLYFTTRTGDAVFRLPEHITGDVGTPERLPQGEAEAR